MASPPTDVDAIIALQSTSSMSSENGIERSDTPSSTDLRGRLPAPDVNRKPRSAEKILDKSRRMAWYWGSAKIKTDAKPDEKVLIEPEFATHLGKSAMCLHWLCRVVKPAGAPATQKFPHKPYEGQIFILRNPTDGNCVFVTAKHNTCSEYNKEGLWEVPFPGSYTIQMANSNTAAEVRIPNVGWPKDENYPSFHLRNGVHWSTGIDISIGPSANVGDYTDEFDVSGMRELLNEADKHTIVTDGSVYAVGMKIGIVAYTEGGPDVEEEKGDLKHDLLVYNILGSKNETVVYLGEITYVGKFHIEYNCNSCGGCSGGPVFVLEKSHPEFGNVLAVHAGHKPQLNSNIGFKVLGHV